MRENIYLNRVAQECQITNKVNKVKNGHRSKFSNLINCVTKNYCVTWNIRVYANSL